jgi:hypothetical protein
MDGCRYVKYSAEDTAIAAVWSRDVSCVCAGIYFVPSNPTPSARASHPPRQDISSSASASTSTSTFISYFPTTAVFVRQPHIYLFQIRITVQSATPPPPR